jgi:hypothetical protein
VDIGLGPVDVYLGDHHLKVVQPERDLGCTFTRDCLIIDPSSFDSYEDIGFKGLGDGEEVRLGKDYDHGRFEFSEAVSQLHALIRREGSVITIQDLNSQGGTFIDAPQHQI